ncbi:MAG: antibiotic biosynthesis monooxygenase [Flavobacterium psychrophilum]|jgi:quinol monooxygenase YgiN|nr:MAG: antibiotic biosynthesis monooxygenase [Flavobacterium psychrophilum]
MKLRHGGFLIWTTFMMTLAMQDSIAQDNKAYMRIAKITVDSVKLNDYIIALKTQLQSALKYEKGVLAYSAVQDKNNPCKITILETYASVPAYQSHIQTDHFKKYKATVADMVKELELNDVIPIPIQIQHK